MDIKLSFLQVGLAAMLIMVSGAISVGLQLKMERRIFIASIRTIVQLLLVGLVLSSVFQLQDVRVVLLLMTLMTLVAAGAATRRSSRRYPGIWINTLISIWSSSWLITIFALIAIVQVEPWFTPRFAIPLLGMVLGNTLNGISLGLDRIGDELSKGRGQIETILALGGTRWEAAHRPISEAVRTGMIPIINSMAVVGIVSLPGMMTGQLLAGAEPVEAVKYQVMIMFLIAAGTSLGTVSAVLLTYRRLFNADHQFRADLISETSEH